MTHKTPKNKNCALQDGHDGECMTFMELSFELGLAFFAWIGIAVVFSGVIQFIQELLGN